MKTRASILIAIAAVLSFQLTAKAALPATTNVTLVWNSVSGAATYTLFWGTASGTYTSSNNATAPQSSNTTSSLLANQFYYFAVTATDGSGHQSSYSAEVNYAPAPGTLAVSGPPGGGPTANASWDPILNAATYTLHWGTASGSYSFNQSCPASQTNLTVSSLVANTTYYFAVTSADTGGHQSGYSEEVVYTNTYVQPPAPGGLVVGPPGGGTTANASWGPVANAATYQLNWGTISHNYTFNNSCSSPQVTLSATSLHTNTVYYFAVGCTASNGLQSALSAEVVYSNAMAAASSTNAPTNSPPVTLANPQNLTALAGTNNGIPGVALSWSAVVNAGGYGLYWGTNSENYVWNESASSTGAVVTNLIGGEIYYFAVMALGGTGTNNSGFSSEVIFTNALPSPTNFTVTETTNGALAAWSSVTNAANYTVFYGSQSRVYAASASCSSLDTSLTVSNLATNKTYYLAVAAIATNGNQGPYSAEVIYTNTVIIPTNNPVQSTNPPVTTPPPVVVLPPLAISVIAGTAANSAVITWGGDTNNTNPTYLLYGWPGTLATYANNSAMLNISTTQTNWVVANLNPNGSYVFQVYEQGVQMPGIAFAYTNVGPTPPATPSGLIVAGGNAANSAFAVWNPVANVSAYQLYWGTNSALSGGVYTTGNTTYNVTGLQTNQTYYFAVACTSNGVPSTNSAAVLYFNAAPLTPAFPPSTNQIPGIPPILGMSVNNQQPNLVIAGTVGAQMTIQATTNIADPTAWTTIDTVMLTNAATGSNAVSTNDLILQAAFVPALQVYVPSFSNSAAPVQFYRVSMPYDYPTLAYQVLPATNYPTRLIGVIMQGLSENACYVTNQNNYIYYDSQSYNVNIQAPAGPSIRQIANSLAGVLNQTWNMAYELSYTNGAYNLLATVVETDPGTDQVAGGPQTSSPIQINF